MAQRLMPLKQLWSWEAGTKKKGWDGLPAGRHNEGELSCSKLP